MIVTVDGPAGSGKSALTKRVADELGWVVLDTGAMYRAVAWKVHRQGVDPNDAGALDGLCRALDIDLRYGEDGMASVIVDGVDATGQLRTEGISRLASLIAKCQAVRNSMVARQRDLGENLENMIAEGRDQGSVVFPHADLKIYLDASGPERARRRALQLQEAGQESDFDEILGAIRARDAQDKGRVASPLVVPDGAVTVDTTGLSLDEVVSKVLELIAERRSV